MSASDTKSVKTKSLRGGSMSASDTKSVKRKSLRFEGRLNERERARASARIDRGAVDSR
jgi:hypothetical protein